jgi:Ca-activated chloride channel family protein
MNTRKERRGFIFKNYEAPFQTPFDKLFEVFKELITYTSGDFDEAIDWLRELDKTYALTDENYSIEDFIEDLKEKGYIRDKVDNPEGGGTEITEKTERAIRKQALEHIFGKLKRQGSGKHKTHFKGKGDEHTGEFREYRYGDAPA